jgi:hypothetical protein
LQIIFGTAVFGTFIELLRRTYDAALKRLATIDLFTSEILSIMRVFAAANIVGDFVRVYDRLQTPVQAPKPESKEEVSSEGLGFADSARAEDYFTVFNANSTDLASLDPAVVNNITAFYTFLKASRDATGAIKLWRSSTYRIEDKKNDIIAIIYLCFLICVHGQQALEKLISSGSNRDIANDIFAGVMLQCFCFLHYVVPKSDYRRALIEKRRKKCEGLAASYQYNIPIVVPQNEAGK